MKHDIAKSLFTFTKPQIIFFILSRHIKTSAFDQQLLIDRFLPWLASIEKNVDDEI